MYNSHMHTCMQICTDRHMLAHAPMHICVFQEIFVGSDLFLCPSGVSEIPCAHPQIHVLHCTQIYTRADTFESTYLHAPMCTSIYTYAHTPPQDNMFEPLEHLEDAKNKTEVCICAKCWTTSLTYTLANTTANPLSECVILWCAYVQKVLSFAKNKLLEYLSDPKVRPSTAYNTLSHIERCRHT